MPLPDVLRERLRDCFTGRDGARREIRLVNVAPADVEPIVGILRAHTAPGGVTQMMWDQSQGLEVPRPTPADLGRRIASGELPPAEIVLRGLTRADVAIPDLNAFVARDEVALGYGVDSRWNSSASEAFIALVCDLVRVSPAATIDVEPGASGERRATIRAAVSEYLSTPA